MDILEKARRLYNGLNYQKEVKKMDVLRIRETLFDLISEVETTREYHRKYMTHDLRKNPQDLPADGQECMVLHIIITGTDVNPITNYVWSVATYDAEMEGGSFWLGMGEGETGDLIEGVVAWKLIEPYTG